MKKQDVITAVVEKFPQAGAKTIARMVYRDNKPLWSGLEACYSAVRNALGVHGERNRGSGDKTYHRPARIPGDAFGPLPQPWEELPDWAAFPLDARNALVLSDVHLPYYDRTAVESALDLGVKSGVDAVLLNGDIADCFAVSRWQTDPRKRDFAKEREVVQQFLEHICKRFRKSKVYYKLGNHEERLESYLWCKAPELLGIPGTSFGEMFGLDKLGITEIRDKRPIMLGKLPIIHGHEYRFAISNPVNPARGLFLRAQTHALCSHFHRTSQHSEKSITEKVIGTFSVGCLCNMHPSYMPINKWNLGFARVECDLGGKWDVHNYRIINGRIYE